jgi:hypothetical protein
MYAHSVKSIQSNARKYNCQLIAMCHHPNLFTEGDNAETNQATGCGTCEGTCDAPGRCTRQDGDQDQDGQVHAVEQVKLLRGHSTFSISRRWPTGKAVGRNADGSEGGAANKTQMKYRPRRGKALRQPSPPAAGSADCLCIVACSGPGAPETLRTEKFFCL